MEQQTCNPPTDSEPAPLPRPPQDDGGFLHLGYIEQTARNGHTLAPEDQEMLDRWQEAAPWKVERASQAYCKWLDANAGDLGFAHVERVTHRHGRVVRTVTRLRSSRACPASRSVPRA